MKTILISGGAGYLGTVLTQHLLKKNIVIVYDEFNFNWLIKNKKKVKFNRRLFLVKKNILDVKKKDFKGVDIVCDLNGIPNDPSSELNKKFTWKINNYARKKFAETAKKAGVEHYIFNSTCAVYGHNNHVVEEDSVKRPMSTYAKANQKSEQFIYSLKSKKFTVHILRNATLYGVSPSMRLDLVINIFVYNYLKIKIIEINGNGKQWRPLISVQDVCKVYSILILKKPKSFICNLVAFNSKIRDLAEKIRNILNAPKSSIVYKKDNIDKRNYNVSNKKFKRIFANFKFVRLDKDVKALRRYYIRYKIKKDIKTVRMLFYKKKLS